MSSLTSDNWVVLCLNVRGTELNNRSVDPKIKKKHLCDAIAVFADLIPMYVPATCNAGENWKCGGMEKNWKGSKLNCAT